MNQSVASFDHSTLLALLEASGSIISEPELVEVLNRVVEQAMAVLEAEGASVLLLDAERNELVFHAAPGPKGRELIGERFGAQQGIAGQAVRTRRAVHIQDVKQNRNFFAEIDAKTNMQTRSLIAAPMIHLDEVIGVLEVINPRGRIGASDGDLELVRVFANLAAAAVRRGQAYDRISRDNRGLRESMPTPRIIGHSKLMEEVLELCRKVAGSNATVMITGETGTGKELVARAIHDLSDRRDKPFIAVNCAALSETLLESEIFGHEKGAFTGATDQKLGRFELADGGTLFLDELGEMIQSTQVKLLRVLQEHEFVRVGGTQTIVCDVRIVAATNRDLKQEMEAGRFRKDLYYRLNVFPITLPPLRQRLDDLPLLIDHFVQQVVPSLGVNPPNVTDEAMRALMNYNWPGNIRELRNIVERCTLLADGGDMSLASLPPEISGPRAVQAGLDCVDAESNASAAGSKLATQERATILQALEEAKWNQSAAARALGISRDHLRYRIKKYGLNRP